MMEPMIRPGEPVCEECGRVAWHQYLCDICNRNVCRHCLATDDTQVCRHCRDLGEGVKVDYPSPEPIPA